jgi:hypothetical protein
LPSFFVVAKEIAQDGVTISGPLPHTEEKRPPQLLVIGSVVDEPWQILHHLSSVENPLAVRSNPAVYLFLSVRSIISQSAMAARIYGAKSYKDLGRVAKVIMGIMDLFVVFIVYLAIIGFKNVITLTSWFLSGWMTVLLLLFVLVFTMIFGEVFFSAFLAPFRWFTRRVVALTSVFPAMITYGVRYWGWSVLLKIVTGLEGYRFKIPKIEQQPSSAPKTFVLYEEMPIGAERRAMDRRSASPAAPPSGVRLLIADEPTTGRWKGPPQASYRSDRSRSPGAAAPRMSSAGPRQRHALLLAAGQRLGRAAPRGHLEDVLAIGGYRGRHNFVITHR